MILHTAAFVVGGSLVDSMRFGFYAFVNDGLAVFVTAPEDIRIARLEKRERERWGKRICEGADMFDNHRKFIEWAKTYDTDNPDRSLQLHERWIKTLPCPVLRIDGALSITENIMRIEKQYHALCKLRNQ